MLQMYYKIFGSDRKSLRWVLTMGSTVLVSLCKTTRHEFFSGWFGWMSYAVLLTDDLDWWGCLFLYRLVCLRSLFFRVNDFYGRENVFTLKWKMRWKGTAFMKKWDKYLFKIVEIICYPTLHYISVVCSTIIPINTISNREPLIGLGFKLGCHSFKKENPQTRVPLLWLCFDPISQWREEP